MHCVLQSTKVGLLMIISIILTSVVAVDGKFPDMTIMKGPYCTGKSESKFYDHNAARLVDLLVDQTKHADRDRHGDYLLWHSMPNRNPGSPTGGATCYDELGEWDCWNCLMTAKSKIHAGCHKPITAYLRLQDCSMWFKMIR